MQTDPQYFGALYSFEVTLTEEQWRARLSNELGGSWGLFDNDICIGLTGIIQLQEEPTVPLLIASFIRKEYRRKGLSALYYQARLEWAKEKGYKEVEIDHRKGTTLQKQPIKILVFSI